MTDFERRICFTLAALAAYRLGAHIPLPGIDFGFIATNPVGDLLPRFSIVSLGVIPYLAAAVLMRLSSAISPRLRALENRSEAGRRKVVRATRFLAVLIAAIEALGFAKGLNVWEEVAIGSGPLFQLGAAATLTAGFVAVMWLSDQITRRGVGNGVALILFADIVSGLPDAFAFGLETVNMRTITLGVGVTLLLFAMAVVVVIVFFERTVRHIWVRYPERSTGARKFGCQDVSIPFKLNNGGFMPAFIVGWLLTHVFGLMTYILLDGGSYTIEGWQRWGWYGDPVHLAVSAVLTVAMAYIYAVALLDPGDIARRLRKGGAVLLETPPGMDAERAIRRLIRGLSLVGGSYLAVVYLLPEAFYMANPNLPGNIGGIGFLIATAVAMDTLAALAHRWKGSYGEPPGEEFGDAIAVAVAIPDQPKVRTTKLSARTR